MAQANRVCLILSSMTLMILGLTLWFEPQRSLIAAQALLAGVSGAAALSVLGALLTFVGLVLLVSQAGFQPFQFPTGKARPDVSYEVLADPRGSRRRSVDIVVLATDLVRAKMENDAHYGNVGLIDRPSDEDVTRRAA
jgi:hypothetical protein